MLLIKFHYHECAHNELLTIFMRMKVELEGVKFGSNLKLLIFSKKRKKNKKKSFSLLPVAGGEAEEGVFARF